MTGVPVAVGVTLVSDSSEPFAGVEVRVGAELGLGAAVEVAGGRAGLEVGVKVGLAVASRRVAVLVEVAGGVAVGGAVAVGVAV